MAKGKEGMREGKSLYLFFYWLSEESLTGRVEEWISWDDREDVLTLLLVFNSSAGNHTF